MSNNQANQTDIISMLPGVFQEKWKKLVGASIFD